MYIVITWNQAGVIKFLLPNHFWNVWLKSPIPSKVHIRTQLSEFSVCPGNQHLGKHPGISWAPPPLQSQPRTPRITDRDCCLPTFPVSAGGAALSPGARPPGARSAGSRGDSIYCLRGRRRRPDLADGETEAQGWVFERAKRNVCKWMCRCVCVREADRQPDTDWLWGIVRVKIQSQVPPMTNSALLRKCYLRQLHFSPN